MTATSTRRAPEGWMELVWVFGYNGHTAHNNVKVTPAGHLLYYVAGVGVVHDLDHNTQTFYTGHDDDITSAALAVEGTVAATGQVGKDAYITVWDATTCTTLSVLRDGHTHKVVCLAFSTDGKLLASVGGPPHKQELLIWEWEKGRVMARHTAHTAKVEEVEWEPGSSARLVTCGHNHIRFWKLSGNVVQSHNGVFGGEAVRDQVTLSHLPDGRVVSGSSSGDLYVWEKRRVSQVIKDVHPGGVLVTEVYPGGLLTGGRDGIIAVFDKQLTRLSSISEPPSLVYDTAGSIHSIVVHNEKVIVGTEKNEVWVLKLGHEGGFTAACVVQGHGLGEVWGLATHPSRPLAITTSDDHTVRLWDLEERRPMATTNVNEAAQAAAFRPDGQQVAVGLSNGAFLVLDAEYVDQACAPPLLFFSSIITFMSTVIYVSELLEEEVRVSDRKEVRHDLKYSPCASFLAVASNDNYVDVYGVESGYQRLHTLAGASSFITHLDWSSDSHFIQLNSGASERLIFDVSKEVVVDEEALKRVDWATWTGVLGSQVAGIWHKYQDVSDINSCDANFYFGNVVTGDDFGLVKLFRFPCTKRGSKSRSFVGHSAHVTNVRWTSDSEYVVSVGGADHAVFLWRFRSSKRNLAPEQRVSLPSVVEGESEEEVVDTEDELEGIPELTIDLEDEFREHRGRSSRRRKKPANNPLLGVEVAADSAFTKRRDAKSSLPSRDLLPLQSLRMKHVFGFRAHECRNNAHLLKSGQLVYHVAAIGVVCDPATRKQRHYLHHTDDILCLTLHPQGEIVASGQVGREASVHVWSGDSLRILSLLQGGHLRGVSCVAFSGDGERLASLGLDDHHTLVVWHWRKGYKIASARGHTDRVFGVRFSPTSENRLVSYGVKHIKFWVQTGGGLTYRQVVMGNKFKQSTVLSSSVVVGSGEEAQEWWLLGLSTGHVLVVHEAKVERSLKAHKTPVYTILTTPENIWTGSQDGFVCKWDLEMKRCVRVFPVTDHFLEDMSEVGLASAQPGLRSLSVAPGTSAPLLLGTQHAELLIMDQEGKLRIIVQGHRKGEVWGLDTHPRLSEAVTVGEDNTLRRWSLEGCHALGLANLRKTGHCVHFHPTAVLLAVGFLDGSVGLYLYPSLEKHGGTHHRSEEISDLKFSPDGRFLAVGSHECVVDLYVVDTDGDMVSREGLGLRRVGLCRGPSSWVTHLSWHQDSRLLQVNTGAGEQLFYEAPYGTRQLVRESTGAELAWHMPLTCPLDATLSGVWGPGMDLTDVNAVATAHHLPLLASVSDDQGLLQLFRYPCQGRPKKHRQYRGHSAHVTNVKWCYDDSLVVTTGGGDTSVVVWTVRQDQDQGQEVQECGSPPHRLSLSPDDLPHQELTVQDLEAAGLEAEEVVVRPLYLPPTTAHRRPKPTTTHTTHLKALPTLTPDDELAFYCNGSIVGCMVMDPGAGGQVRGQRVGYGEQQAQVTAIAISPAQPHVVATAQLGEETEEGEEERGSALVHVWRVRDGTNMALLRGGPQAMVTALTFSPSGRLLASLADSTVVHIFNWVKGVHIAQLQLQVVVMALAHTGETTLAALTPRTLFFLDLVGNSLITTRGQVPLGLFPDDMAFTDLSVSPNGWVYVGCGDGSVVEWRGRVASRRVAAPISSPTLTLPVRTQVVAGQGAVFTTARVESTITVCCYTTDEEELKFFSDSKISSPTGDWQPLSARLGGSLLILGALHNQPFIILDLQSGKFTLVEHG